MTGLVRKATLLAVCGLLASSVAIAHVPDPTKCECNSPGAVSLGLNCALKANVYVVGNTGGVPDAVGEFCVTVRDFNNVPIENSSVVIDFSNCNVQLCTDQLDPDVTVECLSQTVRKLTDVNGVACFKVQGKVKDPLGLDCVADIKDCVEISADGTLLCTGDAPTFDHISNPGDGLNPVDLSRFARLWLVCGTNAPRANYNCTDQVLSPTDLSIFARVWLVLGGSASNCVGSKDPGGPKCP